MVPFEYLLVMPGDVHNVHCRLVWPRDQQGLTCEPIHGPARVVPGDIQAGHADPPLLGDAQDTQVEQRMVQRAQRQRVRYLVGAALAVPAHVSRLDSDGVVAERAVEAAHRALIGVDAQDLFGEAAAARAQTGSMSRGSPACGEVEGGDVEVDGGADQFGEDRGEVQVQEQAGGGGGQGLRVGQEVFDGCSQAAYGSAVQEPGAALGGVRGDLLAGGVAQVPQVAFQVDEGHSGPLTGGGGAGHRRAEVVDQLGDGLFGLLVAGRAAAGRGELAEQPQQQEGFVRCPYLADAGLPEPRQLRQQVVACQAAAFSWSVKVFQVAGAKAS